MKKLLLIFILFILLFASFPIATSSQGNEIKDNQQYSEFQVIPDEAIRLRILANSDKESDQQLKREIRDRVNAEITKWVEDIADIEKARLLIQNKLQQIEEIVADTLEEKGINQSYQVEYGKNVSFPTKIYGSYIYPAGEYEAILITLGKGKGANWWCVLFPPLCFLDFSNGSSVAEEDNDEIEEQETSDQVQTANANEKEVKVEFFFLSWFS